MTNHDPSISQPLLSIVTPTRGSFSETWFRALGEIRGDVEFVMVFPPQAPARTVADPRFKCLVSPLQGEVMQRLVGLLNARGRHVLALDDDDFVHPDIITATGVYFTRFPESWVLRLMTENLLHDDAGGLDRPWEEFPDLAAAPVITAPAFLTGSHPQAPQSYLLELPIAPLRHRFDVWQLLWPPRQRRDMRGVHSENFTNRVWSAARLRPALIDLVDALSVAGPLRLIPDWSLDRLLGLYLQAYYYEPDRTIGHWVRGLSQIRRVHRPETMKETRSHFAADGLLARRFPQYGYFWNLAVWAFYREISRTARRRFDRSNSG